MSRAAGTGCLTLGRQMSSTDTSCVCRHNHGYDTICVFINIVGVVIQLANWLNFLAHVAPANSGKSNY